VHEGLERVMSRYLLITGCHGSLWDLSPPLVPAGPTMDVVLTEREYRALLGLRLLDTDTQRLVCAARLTDDGVILSAGEEDMENLIGFAVAEANHESNRTRQRARRSLRRPGGRPRDSRTRLLARAFAGG
jgi:hypothetical protein